MENKTDKNLSLPYLRDKFIEISGTLFVLCGILAVLIPLVYYTTGLTEQLGYDNPFGMYGTGYQQLLVPILALLAVLVGFGISNNTVWGDWLVIVMAGILLSTSLLSLVISGIGDSLKLSNLFINSWWCLLLITLVHRRLI